MTFEEVYKILYKKYKVARWDDVDKELKGRDDTTINTGELFALIDGLKETYAPKIKMTGKELDFLNSRFKTNDSSGSKVFIDANGRKIEIIPRNLQAWLHPELIEVTDD